MWKCKSEYELGCWEEGGRRRADRLLARCGGVSRSRVWIRSSTKVSLVEGYWDVMMLDWAGNVATGGLWKGEGGGALLTSHSSITKSVFPS